MGDGRGSARAGLLYALGAYTIWGIIPLYFRAVEGFNAEELLAQGQAEARPPRRGPQPPKQEATRACPFCGGEIPSYAQACSHCKKILA